MGASTRFAARKVIGAVILLVGVLLGPGTLVFSPTLIITMLYHPSGPHKAIPVVWGLMLVIIVGNAMLFAGIALWAWSKRYDILAKALIGWGCVGVLLLITVERPLFDTWSTMSVLLAALAIISGPVMLTAGIVLRRKDKSREPPSMLE